MASFLGAPFSKQTPTIRGNKKALAKKLQAAVDRKDTTWDGILEHVILYAGCDTVRQGFIVLPATWCSETNDNGPGWAWEYEIPKSAEEILAAKPLSERTLEDWREILGVTTEFNKHWLGAHPDEWRDAPAEILQEYGLEKQYG